MGKIAPISAKYIIHADIKIDGVVEKPDVIGAIFGQTEGLLGTDLELRELQNSGRIGRIDAILETRAGKTYGEIIVPSSMDRAETAIIAAALETIDRIGPCNAQIKVKQVEDVRVAKRKYLLERAKEILKDMINKRIPDSAEISEEVKKSVRALEVEEWGPDRLAAGPGIKDADEIIIVEGRADVINLLKNGFKNVIALNGTSIPRSLIPLTKQKHTILFLDGDRGGDLILKGAVEVGADIDFVARAPPGREVEELTKKEIHQALRAKVPFEQLKTNGHDNGHHRHERYEHEHQEHQQRRSQRQEQRRYRKKPSIEEDKLEIVKNIKEEIMGSRAAAILGEDFSLLGKVPISELPKTLKNFKGAAAVVLDGNVTKQVLSAAEASNVKYLIAKDSDYRSRKVNIITEEDISN